MEVVRNKRLRRDAGMEERLRGRVTVRPVVQVSRPKP